MNDYPNYWIRHQPSRYERATRFLAITTAVTCFTLMILAAVSAYAERAGGGSKAPAANAISAPR